MRSSQEAAAQPGDPEAWDAVDMALAVITIVPLLCVLMFATSSMTEALRRRSVRRRLGAGLLALQIIGCLIILGVIAA